MALGGVNLYQAGHFTQAFGGAGTAWTMRPGQCLAAFGTDAVGDVSFDLQAGGLSSTVGSAWFACDGQPTAAVGADASVVAIDHTSNTRKRVTCLQNQALGGRSALTNHAVCFAGFGQNGPLFGRILGIGSVVGATGLWRNAPMGRLGVADRTGAGLYRITIPATEGLDPLGTVLLASPRGARVIGTAPFVAVAQTSATVKNINTATRVGAGAAAAPADRDFDVVLLGMGAGLNRGAELFAAASVNLSNVAATYNWQGPRCGALTFTGAGDCSIALPDDIADADMAVLLSSRMTQASAGVVSQAVFTYVKGAGTIQILSQIETAAGGAFIAPAAGAPNTNFDIAIFRLGTA